MHAVLLARQQTGKWSQTFSTMSGFGFLVRRMSGGQIGGLKSRNVG